MRSMISYTRVFRPATTTRNAFAFIFGSIFPPYPTLTWIASSVAGKKLINHHVYSCSRLENLSEIILLGYKTHDTVIGRYMRFVRTVSKDYGISTR